MSQPFGVGCGDHGHHDDSSPSQQRGGHEPPARVFDLFEEMGLLGAQPIDVPINQNQKILEDKNKLFRDPNKYIGLVGKLNYLSITKPVCSQSNEPKFLEAPRVPH